MAIGPSDTLMPQRRDPRPRLENLPIATSAPAPPSPANRPRGAGAVVPGVPSLPSVMPAEQATARPRTEATAAARPPQPPSVLAPGLAPAERGAAFRDVVAGQVDKAKTFYGGVAAGAGAVSDVALAPVRAVGEFAQGALGVPPPVAPGLREKMLQAQAARAESGGPGSNPQVSMLGAPTAAAPSAAQAAAGAPAAPQPPAAPAFDPRTDNRNFIIGPDGQPRFISAGAPSAAQTPAQVQTPPAAAQNAPPPLPSVNVPSSVPRADPSRTAAGDEATRSAMQEIQSQLFRNSFAAGRGSRSARALQGTLTQSLASLAPTLGASADAADARNAQTRAALAQQQVQQRLGEQQAQTAASINDRRSQSAELVAQIGAGARAPTLITGEQGAFSVGPNGQAAPVLAPDGQQVRPAGAAANQQVRPDTLFKEFNGRLTAIQGDVTLSPEVKAQQIQQLYSDPLFQGLAQYLPQ